MLVFSRSLWILCFICNTCIADKCMPGCLSKWSNPSFIQKPRNRLYVSMVWHRNGWFSLVKFSSLKCKHFSRLLIKSDTPPPKDLQKPLVHPWSFTEARWKGKNKSTMICTELLYSQESHTEPPNCLMSSIKRKDCASIHFNINVINGVIKVREKWLELFNKASVKNIWVPSLDKVVDSVSNSAAFPCCDSKASTKGKRIPEPFHWNIYISIL